MLNEVMPFAASFDFTEHHEGRIFDILWDKILHADHNIKFEEANSWAQFLNSIQVCLTRVTQSEKSESLPKGIPSESPQIGSTDHTRIIWNPCTIFSTDYETISRRPRLHIFGQRLQGHNLSRQFARCLETRTPWLSANCSQRRPPILGGLFLPMRGSWNFWELFQFVTIGIEWVAACV